MENNNKTGILNKGIVLRAYQKEAVDAMLKMEKGQRGLINAPTGSGKTIVMAKYCELMKENIIIIVDAEILLQQTKHKLMNFVSEEEMGLVQSDKFKQLDRRITICMRQTILHPKSTKLNSLVENKKIPLK